MSNFFSKTNIHNFLWALFGAFVLFLCGLAWNWWNGPDEVKVINSDQSRKDTTITIIKFEPTELAQNENQKTTTQTSPKTKSKPTYQLDPALVDSMIKKALAKQGVYDNTLIQSNGSNPSESDNTAPTYRPKFTIPTIVSGYSQGKVNSYATININKTEFVQTDFIELTTDFFKASTLEKITPLFVDIVKRKTENSVYQIWRDQFKLVGSKTKIKLSASFPPDNYELTIGFYMTDELNTKYPTFYLKKFTITVK